MLKSISLLTRKAGDSREAFLKAWVDEHAPMAIGIPGLHRYCLNIIQSEPDRPDVPTQPVKCDGIAELWYLTRADMERAVASPEMKRLRAHGATFIGEIKSYTVEEKVIIGGKL
jgi:uncharacterized protein (TIGR02118 family)